MARIAGTLREAICTFMITSRSRNVSDENMNIYPSNKINFNTLFYYLGQHVSTLIESSSGPSKIQILT